MDTPKINLTKETGRTKVEQQSTRTGLEKIDRVVDRILDTQFEKTILSEKEIEAWGIIFEGLKAVVKETKENGGGCS